MVKQNLFKKIIIIIAFITISISSFLVSVSLADEPCEDKPTTGKYSCYDMANKLGLCEKSEHVRALCPKSCKACPNDSAGANAAPSTPAPAKESSTSKENESAQLEMLKNQHALEISRLLTTHEESAASYAAQVESFKSQIESLKNDYDIKIQAIHSDHAAIIAEAKEANGAASDTLKESYQQKEANYKKEFEGKLEAMKNNIKKKEDEYINNNMKISEAKDAEIKEWKEKYESLNNNNNNNLDNNKAVEEKEQELNAVHVKEIEELKSKHAVEIEKLKEEHNGEISTMKDAHAKDVEEQKKSLNDEIEKLKASGQESNDGLVGKVAELEAANAGYSTSIKSLEEDLVRVKSELAASEAAATTATKEADELKVKLNEAAAKSAASTESSDDNNSSNEGNDDLARLQTAHNTIKEMEDEMKTCKLQKTKLSMIEMQIDQKDEDIAKCKKRLEKIESEKRGEDETKDAAVRNLESQIEEKDKLLSECNVSNEKSAKALEELTLENTSNQEKNVDLGLQVQELTEKHTECVGKAASVPPPSECNNEEDKATINRLQKEIDEKQLKFDSSIIQMQEDHAQALMLAKQSVVEVDANGDSATASTGSDGGENKDNHDNENGEIKLTDDASFDKCSQLQSDFDKLKKEMDACDADLTIAKAVIDEHAVVSPEVEQLAALSTDEEKQNFVKSLTDARDNCLADLRDANQALKESKESNTAIATNGGDQCQNDLAVAMGTIEEKDMKIKEFEAGVDMDCHSQLVQVKGELAQLKSNDNGDNANENNKDEAEHSNFEKCKKDLDNANSKIEEQALKIMSNDNGNCPPETIKTMETCTADLKSCHAALDATTKLSDPSSSSGEISSDTDVVTDPLLLGEEAGDPLGLAATGAAADNQSNSTVEEMKDQLARLNAKLIEDNRIHDETVERHRLEMAELKKQVTASSGSQKEGDTDVRGLLGSGDDAANKLAAGITMYSYGTLGLIIVCIYSIIPLGKAYPNGCSIMSIGFFWILFIVLASLLLFVPGSIESITGSPNYVVQTMCGKEVDWMQCLEQSADSNPAIAIGMLCLMSLVSFVLVSQLPNFTYYTLVAFMLSCAVNGACASLDATSPSAPMCYSLQSFLNEQTTLALADVCIHGNLAGCRITASNNLIIACTVIFVASLFCVGLIALYVELVGDMTASDEPFQPPVIANSIGANPNGPTIPGQEPPPNLQLPPTQQTANNSNSNRPSTQQIFAKARAAAQAEITELKAKQAKEIEAIRQQYQQQQSFSSGGSNVVSSQQLAELEKKHMEEISAMKQAYEKQIQDLNTQQLTTSGSNNSDFMKLQTQHQQATVQLEQAFADLQSWEDAYKELQAHNQSQKETYEKQIEEVQANSTAATSTKKDNSDLDTRLKSLEKANDALNNQLKLTKQELENAHATHRQVLGEMQSDYDKEQQSLKFKLGEVVKRFKMLKAQNDNQKQMIHELTSRMKGNSSNGVGSVMSNGNSKSSSGSSFI